MYENVKKPPGGNTSAKYMSTASFTTAASNMVEAFISDVSESSLTWVGLSSRDPKRISLQLHFHSKCEQYFDNIVVIELDGHDNNIH